MEAYIQSLCAISPCHQFDSNGFQITAPAIYEKEYLTCIEPDYKEIINPNLIRRMGRVIKMGVAASMKCLKDINLENPDAIITGTSLGCIEDTEKFLGQIVANKEQFLPPTSFIQSTHNTIAGQIALLLKCNSYNYTYVHRNFSFENALQDSMMMLSEHPSFNVLLGGIDEITEVSYCIMKRLGIYKSALGLSTNMFRNKTEGSIAGEGATFFVLSGNKENAIAAVNGVKIFYKPNDISETINQINQFLAEKSLLVDDIDAVIMGLSGDSNSDKAYDAVAEKLFSDKNILYYKHLCGEYFTSSAYALWTGANIIRHQQIPDSMKYNIIEEKPPKNILVYNHYNNAEHSLIHLSAC